MPNKIVLKGTEAWAKEARLRQERTEGKVLVGKNQRITVTQMGGCV